VRVLFLTHYELLLGANRSLLDVLEGLMPLGVEPFVFIPRSGPLEVKLQDLKIGYKIIEFREDTFVYRRLSRLKGLCRHFSNLSLLPKLERECLAFSPDVIYSNSSVILSGARLSQRLGIPHVWHIREYGKQDYNIGYNFGEPQFVKYANQAAALVAISQDLANQKLRNVSQPIYRVYNGVGKKSFFERFNSKKPQQEVVFLCLGVIHPAKGQLQAVEAFRQASAQNPNLRLKIVGQPILPDYYEKVKTAAQGLAVDFEGYTDDPFAFLSQADVLLMCSQNEAMGRVTAEALCCGLPVVGFEGGATPELISTVGILYRTQTELSEAMLKLASDQTLRTELSIKSKKFGLENFTQEICSHKIFEILKKVCNQPSK
jgi:glycosyltransferase involved in cell wall biosynthesis